jgi:hypothetical protein
MSDTRVVVPPQYAVEGVYGGREWVDAVTNPRGSVINEECIREARSGPKFKVVSYNVLAQVDDLSERFRTPCMSAQDHMYTPISLRRYIVFLIDSPTASRITSNGGIDGITL